MVLETRTKRFIGHSTDTKPTVGIQLVSDENARTTTDADLPAGSTFLESDTGDIWRWDGVRWTLPIAENDALLREFRSLREEVAALRLGMIQAGTAVDVRV